MNLRIVSLAALAVFSSAFASANLVVNGSFEQPLLNPGWNYLANDGVTGGWYADAGYSSVIEIGGASNYGVAASDGVQVLETDSRGNSKTSQMVSGSNLLKVSFDYAGRSGVADASRTFDVLWNDVVVASFGPTSTAWTTYTFTTTTASGKLSFLGTGTSDSFGALIDNVTAEAVPEPATMAALAVGLAALGRRRKKA